MSSVKPKNSLLSKTQLANLISFIVLEVKDQFKNLSLTDLKQDINLVLFVAEKVEAYCKDNKTISASTLASIDKNDLVVQVFIALFPDLSDSEKTFVQNTLEFIISSNLIQTTESIIKKVANIIKKL